MPDTPTDEHEALAPLGWDDRLAALVAGAERPTATVGRVGRVDRGLVTVLTAAGAVRAAPAPELRTGDPLDLPATGDWVLIEESDEGHDVTVVFSRRSAFVRGDPMEGAAADAQVVAANVDTVFIVQSLSNGPNLRRLERELVLAFDSGATPVVVLTKADELSTDEARAAVRSVERTTPGIEILVTSSVTGEGVDGLRAHAAGNRTVALIGASGVGKSTLVNRLVGDDVQATGAVRATDQRGRHITTARELVLLPGGGVLVDTPGLRAVTLWDSDEGMSLAFSDIEELAGQCRFRNCAHDREPGCAVKAAVARGDIDAARVAHYRHLNDELDASDKKRVELIANRATKKVPKK